jgi:hypothetical protein
MRLKNGIEEVRGCLGQLEAVPNQQAELYASIMRYWSEGNCLSWNVIDIASLGPTPLSTGVQAITDGNSMRWIHSDSLPCLLFPNYTQLLALPSVSVNPDLLERFLITRIQAQEDLKPHGSRASSSKTLSVHLSQCAAVGEEGHEFNENSSL